MTWLISIPAWGAYYRKLLVEQVMPSHHAALLGFAEDVRYLVHTDAEWELHEAFVGLKVKFRPIADLAKDSYQIFGDCHRKAVKFAWRGNVVVFLCADMVLSKECFHAARERFVAGSKAVFMPALRVVGEPPVAATSRELLAWNLAHLHPMVSECYWNRGKTLVPWNLLFAKERSTVMRAFHLHPFAALIDRNIVFAGTCDDDLPDNYFPDEIHVVRDADEMSAASITPETRLAKLGNYPVGLSSTLKWALKNASRKHWWFLQHRICLAGENVDCGDDEVVAKLIARESA